jgi:hypothetical protein
MNSLKRSYCPELNTSYASLILFLMASLSCEKEFEAIRKNKKSEKKILDK